MTGASASLARGQFNQICDDLQEVFLKTLDVGKDHLRGKYPTVNPVMAGDIFKLRIILQ
jgi:hypothetical protein